MRNINLQNFIDASQQVSYTSWDSYNQKDIQHLRFNEETFLRLILQEAQKYSKDLKPLFTFFGEDYYEPK